MDVWLNFFKFTLSLLTHTLEEMSVMVENFFIISLLMSLAKNASCKLNKCKGKWFAIIINQEDGTIMHYFHKQVNAL